MIRLQNISECSVTFYTTLARTLKNMAQIYQMMVIQIYQMMVIQMLSSFICASFIFFINR